MSDHVPTPALPDTTPIRRLIRRTRRLLRSSWVITGLGLTVGLLLGTLVAATLVDLVAPLWVGLRLAALILVAVPAGWVLLTRVLFPLCRRLTAVTVARRIEKHIPGIHNRLVSSLDLSGSGNKPAVSQAFYRRLLNEALERIRGFRIGRVVDFFRLRRAALYALTSTAAFALAFYLFSDRLPTAIDRILHPFADIPPASGVVYTVSPGDDAVLRGDDIVFTAQVTKGEPERLDLVCESPAAESALQHPLEQRGNNLWTVTLSGKLPTGFEKGFTYRVHGGGTYSKQHQITLVERPVIANMYTVLHYPKYMALPPEKRLSAAQTAEVAGPEGGQVEVVVEAEGDVQRGEVQLLKEKLERRPVKNRSERLWFEKTFPAGAKQSTVWKWNHEAFHERKHSHSADAPSFGGEPATHGFHSAKTGFQVQPGEVLFAYVFLPRDQMPKTIVLEWHDGSSWEHRAYWGDDQGKKAPADAPGWQNLGALPPAGKWARLEVPAGRVGLDGKALVGMNFKVIDGECFGQCAGSLPPSHKEKTVYVPAKRHAMRPLGKNVWSGKFPLQGNGLYRVELWNTLGHPSKEMKPSKFKSLPDDPPVILLDRPESPLPLSSPRKVQLALRAFDDYGLKEVALHVKRSGQTEWSRRVIKRYPKPRLDDVDLTTTLNLPGMKMVLGDSLAYKVEAVDRKGQATISPEFLIQLTAAPNAADQKLTDFEKTQDPFQLRLANLIAAQVKVHQDMEKVTAKYAPLLEKIKIAKAEAQARLDPASAKLVEMLRNKLSALALEQAKAKELGLTLPKLDPNQPPPNLDPESSKLLADAKQKLTELAQERQKNADTPSAQPQLDAESQKVLQDMTRKLADLARLKALTATKPAKTPTTPAKLDKASAKLLANLEKKLAQLDAEREKNSETGKSSPPSKPAQLDVKSAQDLAAMQKELADLARQQQANLQTGDQISKDLAKSAEEASQLQMLRGEIARQMRATAQKFEQQAVQAMKDLLGRMNQAATAKKETPPEGKDLEKILQKNERLRKELEALKKRLEALAKARKDLLAKPDEALAQLKKDMLREESGLSARDLKELQDYLARLNAELKKQKGNQQKLKDETGKTRDLTDVEKKQDDLDKDVDKVLEKAKKLQANKKMKRLNKKRKFNRPKSPYSPDGDEEKITPKEEDSDEPLPEKKKKDKAKDKAAKPDAGKDKKKKADDEDDDDDKKFLPQLGGKKKIDPRHAKKMPKNKKKKNSGKSKDDDDADERRDNLQDHQDDNLRDLDEAEKATESDADTLQSLMDQIDKAVQASQSKNSGKGKGEQESDAEADPAAQELARMLQSPAMRQAMAMLQRMRQGKGQPQQPMPGGTNPNLTGNDRGGPAEKIDLSKLDLPTRTMILKMQAKPRENLNQGKRKEGPEGYQKHIREYYNRLGKLKASKK